MFYKIESLKVDKSEVNNAIKWPTMGFQGTNKIKLRRVRRIQSANGLKSSKLAKPGCLKVARPETNSKMFPDSNVSSLACQNH